MLAPTADRQREVIGERTLLQRRRRRVSQRALSAALGWGPNRVSQIERAVVNITTADVFLLAAQLETSPEYLMGLVDDSQPLLRTGIKGIGLADAA